MALALSIFDLDHTLIQKNISFAFGGFLYKTKRLSFCSALYCTSCYVRYKIIQPSIEKLHSRVMGSFLNGFCVQNMRSLVDKFLDRHLERMLYRPAIERLQAAKEAGHHVVLMSGSPDFLVGPVAERLGVDDWLATRYKVDEASRLASIDQVLQGRHKAQVAICHAGALSIDKEQIYAFTDSMVDLPLLEAAGNPVGVRPERRLKQICQERGWEIL